MNIEELNENLNNIKIEISDNVLIMTMNRPKALNALNNETLEEINKITELVKNDNNIYGLIITGEGKGFVAGADIKQMVAYKSEEGRDYAEFAQDVFNRIESLSKPVIAAVNGYALGGGCELALSCDLRIASDKAIFAQPEVGLGIIPCFGGTQRLTRLVGTGYAKEMIYTGNMFKAEEAHKIGLVNKVVSPEKLLDTAKEIMEVILSKSPIGIKYAKKAINKGADMDLMNALELEKDLVGLCFAADDKEIGMNAFINKKAAEYRKSKEVQEVDEEVVIEEVEEVQK